MPTYRNTTPHVLRYHPHGPERVRTVQPGRDIHIDPEDLHIVTSQFGPGQLVEIDPETHQPYEAQAPATVPQGPQGPTGPVEDLTAGRVLSSVQLEAMTVAKLDVLAAAEGIEFAPGAVKADKVNALGGFLAQKYGSY